MMGDTNVVGPATLSITQAVATFFTFLPALRDVRKAQNGDEIAKDVRAGELAASAVALGIGTIISALTQSPVPVYVCAVIVGVLVLVYEITLRRVS